MLAAKHDLSKDDLDAFGFASQQSAIAAQRAGAFDAEIVPVEVELPDGRREAHTVDEGIRFDATLEGVKGVKLISEGGRLTAATSSQIADGASGVMVVNDRGLKALGVAAAGAHPSHDRRRRGSRSSCSRRRSARRGGRSGAPA